MSPTSATTIATGRPRITDALGHVTSTDYDPAGNKNWIKRATGTGVESTTQFVEYDPMNRLKHQIDERGVHTYFHYDDPAQQSDLADRRERKHLFLRLRSAEAQDGRDLPRYQP